jgi:hypothetical protein
MSEPTLSNKRPSARALYPLSLYSQNLTHTRKTENSTQHLHTRRGAHNRRGRAVPPPIHHARTHARARTRALFPLSFRRALSFCRRRHHQESASVAVHVR